MCEGVRRRPTTAGPDTTAIGCAWDPCPTMACSLCWPAHCRTALRVEAFTSPCLTSGWRRNGVPFSPSSTAPLTSMRV